MPLQFFSLRNCPQDKYFGDRSSSRDFLAQPVHDVIANTRERFPRLLTLFFPSSPPIPKDFRHKVRALISRVWSAGEKVRIFHAIFQRAKQLFHLRAPDRRKSTYVDFLRRAQSAVESLLVFEKRHDVCLDDTVSTATRTHSSVCLHCSLALRHRKDIPFERDELSSRSGF